ncbi:hypothetical protein B5V01_13590 [Mesorhizobium erdmanii]|uniref:Aldehyde dehydrogenase domain-containing protein n=1 Tax=Mesorhizobium erdmanii TaxID=1777866 RepID=A0A4Q1V5U8_9HYPH|nr:MULTISPECIES: aldehyde dehydrogenase family protein [Mesorhizobium]RXT45896.1 hypothetical protein B5V01_13590 [Mesorhizobium erdmanii]
MYEHFARTIRHYALERLADRRLLRELAYVDGQWTARQAAENPASGATVAFVAALDARQTTKAINGASRIFFPGWRALLPQERSKILRK